MNAIRAMLAQGRMAAPTAVQGEEPPPDVTVNFMTAPYSGVDSWYDGCLGFRFTPVSDITVVALGRSVNGGALTQNHDVAIYRDSGSLQVAIATITPASDVDAGYAYELLETPVVLLSTETYRIASREFASGDAWRIVGDISSHTAVATVEGGCYAGGAMQYPFGNNGGADTGYVPPTFFYLPAGQP